MSSTFRWRLLGAVGVMFLGLFIANIVVTLLIVFDIRNNHSIDDDELMFIEVTNFIFAGLLFLSLVGAAIGTPTIIYYQSRTQSMINVGLRKAQTDSMPE